MGTCAAALDSIGETNVLQQLFQRREVLGGVGGTPAHSVGAVDVGREDGERGCHDGRRPPIGDQLTLGDGGPVTESDAQGEHHDAGQDRVAEVQCPIPSHGQSPQGRKHGGVWVDWNELLVVVERLCDSNVAGGKGTRQGTERAECRPAEEVETVHEVNCHNGSVALSPLTYT